jgi:hypothetical protein
MIPFASSAESRVVARHSRRATRVLTAIALTLAASAASCHRERGEIRDVSAEAAANVAQRLQGDWVLVSFQPEVPLEGALQALLNVQIERMVVHIKGNAVHAEGVGVTIDRTYRVADVYGDHFKALLVDPYGVGLESSCDFSGNLLVVNGLNNPWRGRATFRRRV